MPPAHTPAAFTVRYRGAVNHVAQLCTDVPAVLTPLLFILARNVGGKVLSNLRRPGGDDFAVALQRIHDFGDAIV